MEPVNPIQGQPIGHIPQTSTPAAAKPVGGASFDAVMRRELERVQSVRFSAHALSRVASRNIHIGDGERVKLAEAVDRAHAKGAQDSLVLLDNAALVVSVANRTVVTVLDRDEMRGNVFTNIDSAVIMG